VQVNDLNAADARLLIYSQDIQENPVRDAQPRR
jgi:hypothetical protein